jgi:hypothetical protein
MMFFVVLFAPPLYFARRKKWGAFICNSFLYGLACLFLISIIGAFIAPFFWILAVGHAGWHLRTEMASQMIQEHAEVLATKMAEKMKVSPQVEAQGKQ